jgi:hypothetical protein
LVRFEVGVCVGCVCVCVNGPPNEVLQRVG